MRILPARGEPHLIRYQPQKRAYRDHLVAHELAHLIRFYEERPSHRVVAVGNDKHLWAAGEEIEQDLERLHALGLSPYNLNEMLRMWVGGLVTQVTNYPADMRIERWLRSEYTAISDIQEMSLRDQLRDNEKVLRPRVRQFTPQRVYTASVTMNAALAHYLCRLYENKRLAGAYERSDFWSQGWQLGELVWTSDDRGYIGDASTSDDWARTFGLEKWFEWKKLEDVRPAEAT